MEMLFVNIFGSVKLRYKDQSISSGKSHSKSKKMWVLLEYLLINRGRTIPQAELIDVLWSEAEISNPSNSLKVLVFKLRKELDQLNYIPGKDIVLGGNGTYAFNNELPLAIDIVDFERLVNLASSDNLEESKRQKYMLEALKCFKGNIFSEAQREPWAVSLQTHYNDMYRGILDRLVEVFYHNREYNKVIEICNDALKIQPFEERYYYHMVRSYAAMENYSEAAEMYDQVKKIMDVQYGTLPDREFELAYSELMKKRPKKNLSVGKLSEELEEKMNALTSFRVEYGEFRQLYRFVARRLARNGETAYMSLFTLGMQKDAKISTRDREKNLKILEDALSFTLRQGDVFTRATPNQFAVIFVDVSKDNLEAIAQRIEDYIKKNRTKEEFGVMHTVKRIKPAILSLN